MRPAVFLVWLITMDFFALALAGLCFFLVFGARKRLIDAETRILMLERQIKQLAGLAPLSPTESAAPTEAAPLPSAVPEPVVPPVAQAARVVKPDIVRATPAPPAPARNYGPKPDTSSWTLKDTLSAIVGGEANTPSTPPKATDTPASISPASVAPEAARPFAPRSNSP